MLGGTHASHRVDRGRNGGGSRHRYGRLVAGAQAVDMAAGVRLPLVDPGRDCRDRRGPARLAARRLSPAADEFKLANNVLVAAKGIEHRLNTLPAEATPADPRLRSSVDWAVRIRSIDNAWH